MAPQRPTPDQAKKFYYDKDSGYAELKTQFRSKGATVFVGWLQSSGLYKPKPKEGEREPITIAQIAAIHEFGSKDGTIPQRSMLGATLDTNESKILAVMAKLINKMLDKKISERNALGVVGQKVVDLVRARIVRGIPPKLKDSTLARKGDGKSTPLIDTGQLLGSISFEVRRSGHTPGSK